MAHDKPWELAADLSELLDLRVSDPRNQQDASPLTEQYPAVEALIQCGVLATPAIVDAVATQEGSPEFIRNAVYVLTAIMGDPSLAREEVNYLLRKYKDERAKRLIDFLGMIPKGSTR